MFLVLARGKLYIHTFSSKFISPDVEKELASEAAFRKVGKAGSKESTYTAPLPIEGKSAVQALCFESQTDIINIRHSRSSIFPAGMEIKLE